MRCSRGRADVRRRRDRRSYAWPGRLAHASLCGTVRIRRRTALLAVAGAGTRRAESVLTSRDARVNQKQRCLCYTASKMFVGHYSVAFAAKSERNKIPLWVLFVAVQFLDYIWATLVLLGIEKLRVIKGFTAGSMLDSYFPP